MNIFDYDNGVHESCGKEVKVVDDIIVTPFFTKEYCEVIVDFCQNNSQYFINTEEIGGDPYPNYSLYLPEISGILFKKYATHFMTSIEPVLREVFMSPVVTRGFFSPFINRFTVDTQTTMGLHSDTGTTSIVVKLNEDFTGGDLFFPRQNFSLSNVPVGHAVIFPSLITHPHCVNELTSGERFTLVGFTIPPEWNSNGILLV